MKKPLVKKFLVLGRLLGKEFYNAPGGQRQVNHKLRLKKRYKKHGVDGVVNYCKSRVNPERFNEFEDKIRQDFAL